MEFEDKALERAEKREEIERDVIELADEQLEEVAGGVVIGEVANDSARPLWEVSGNALPEIRA